MRTVFFQCNLRNFRGAHLKLWDYFGHVLATPGFTPRITFTARSRWDEMNPWLNAREYVVDDWRSLHVDVFFVGGRQWELAEQHPDWGDDSPVINFVQHVHHADVDNDRYQYLTRRAIRVCVAQEVSEALRQTGLVRGPLLDIPNGIDIGDFPPKDDDGPEVDVLIAALKRPDIGLRLRDRLEQPGRRIHLLTERLHRSEYLRQLQAARVTVFLPNDTEGFYLPALEGLAAGTLVVCPDCIGNRSFCLPGYNAFLPSFAIEELAAAAEAALALPEERVRQMSENAQETAERYSLRRERRAFHDVLTNIDRLWQNAHAAEPAALAR
ncbi:MAG: glycosyltransferase [Chloroflexota bacterium]|nr:glycosyltransferase [Chloroflexota bacterium]